MLITGVRARDEAEATNTNQINIHNSVMGVNRGEQEVVTLKATR